MQKLVWQNANGVELDLTSGNYGITEWEGFSNASLNIQSQQVPFQDGGVFLDALIEQRELSVTLAMQDNNNLELRYQNRRELISALNPKLGEGYLIYTNDFISKRIKCVPQIPLFETHNSDTVGTPKASLSWTACEPYWEDLEETTVEIPLNTLVAIQNNGDVLVMPKIQLDSVMLNPIIANQSTDKGIKLEMTTDKNVYISTETGKKGVYTTKANYEIKYGQRYRDSITVAGTTILVGSDICIINEFGVGSHYPSPVTRLLNCINYANGVYLIGTDGDGILRSTDLKKWEIIIEPSDNPSAFIRKLSFVNQTWIACGRTGGLPAFIAYSNDDGVTWNYATQYEFYDTASYVIFYNDTYYIRNGSYFRCTSDFTNWTSIEPANIPSDIIEVENNIWIGVTEAGKIVESTDPSTWSIIATPTEKALSKLVKLNNEYFGLGNKVIVKGSTLYDWEDITPETTLPYYDFTCANFILNKYSFYLEYGGIFITYNLTDWETENASIGDNISIKKAFGYYYILRQITSSESEILRSSDGENFEKLNLSFPETIRLKGMLVAENQLIVYSSAKVYITNNGEDFVEKDIGVSIGKIQYVNNLYFVMNALTTYKGEDLDSLEDINVIASSITYYNGTYYKTSNQGSNEELYSSNDLETWTHLQTFEYSYDQGLTIINGGLLVISSNKFYYFNNLGDFTQYKSYMINKGSVWSYYEKDNAVWICGSDGLIGKTSNGTVWEIQYTCGNLNSVCVEDKKLFVGNYTLLVEITNFEEIDTDNNLISKLSLNSNLNWELTQGQNNIYFTCDDGDGKAIVTYRQKYIGV